MGDNANNSSTDQTSEVNWKDIFDIGDLVQIKPGWIDVTNGVEMKTGWKYSSDGGSLWGTVTKVVENWKTGSKYGLPSRITKVVISSGNNVVWQVEPGAIAPKIIKQGSEDVPQPEPKDPVVEEQIEEDNKKEEQDKKNNKGGKKPKGEPAQKSPTQILGQYVPAIIKETTSKLFDTWQSGISSLLTAGMSTTSITKKFAKTAAKKQNLGTLSKYEKKNYNVIRDKVEESISKYTDSSGVVHRENVVSNDVAVIEKVLRIKDKNVFDNPSMRMNVRDTRKSIIQNKNGFPYQLTEGSTGAPELNESKTAKISGTKLATYDYSFIPGDERYDGNNKFGATFEDRMALARASLGLPVHGDQDLARYMKMYMYNRFKVPDMNMAHHKSFVHVFFTRPDCNLLDFDGVTLKPSSQVENHTDTALLWRKNPELFKMLTDYRRCGDNDNFNMLLSNQVTSFTLGNEGLNVVNVGKTWTDHEMVYAESYNGKTSGDFTCTFDEVNDYSIIKLMKLWTTYIANVSNGAWSPYYPTFDPLDPSYNKKVKACHVYDRALDYAASVYVFWVGEDGSDVLYWTKYFGVFPSVNGADALSWTKTGLPNETPKLSIQFKYCYKSDTSAMSLLEFNQIANVNPEAKDSEKVSYIHSYDQAAAGSSKPFVGAPFIELNIPSSISIASNDVNYGDRASIRLKFKPSPKDDTIFYKYHLSSGIKQENVNSTEQENVNLIETVEDASIPTSSDIIEDTYADIEDTYDNIEDVLKGSF